MALSAAFQTIKILNDNMLKGASLLAKEQGMTGKETIFYIHTTTGKFLFDISDRKNIEETLLKVSGDVIQGILLKPLGLGLGVAIDISLIATGNSFGDLLVYIKRNVVNEYWDYVQNWPDNYGNMHEYAKIAMRKDISGNWVPILEAGKYVFEEVSRDEYSKKIMAQNLFYSELSRFNPEHEVTFIDGVLKGIKPQRMNLHF